MNVPTPGRVSSDGGWLDAGWTVRTPVGPFAAVNEEGADAIAVRLPHDAMRDLDRSPDAPSKGASAYYPPAAFTYRRALDVPAEWRGRRVRLEIEGAFRRAQVFVDDELAGNRADGYARFFVDLTPYLRWGGTSELRIEVRAGEDSRWYSGCGLHRPVRLHVDRPIHVVPDGVRVVTERIEDDQAVLAVTTTVANDGPATATVRVASDLAAPDGTIVEHDDTPLTLAPGETAPVRQRLYVADPALWSPDSPALHTATVRLAPAAAAEDRAAAEIETRAHEVEVGIRTVTVDPRKGLRINGEPVLLRGACIHHDNGALGAAAIGRAEERRVELLRDAGFNAIRAAHNPLSSAMLDACDRLGVLVMDEAFDQWTRAKTPYDPAFEFPQWWRDDLAAMVAKDANHPSVIMYSIGNEIAEVGSAHGARWARALAEEVRRLDPTRPVTNGVNVALAVLDELAAVIAESGKGLNEMLSDMGAAMNALACSDVATRRIEESSAALDVLGINYAEGRYGPDAEAFPHRVLVGSETFPSQIGTLWPMVEAHANVIGDFTWTGWDYLGEVGIGATAYADDPDAVAALEREFPWRFAWCGDLDVTGHRRPVSYYREIVFGRRTDPHIAVVRPDHHGRRVAMQSPWAWSDSVASWTWPGHEGAPITVEVAAAADEVELVLDGEPVASAAVPQSSEPQPGEPHPGEPGLGGTPFLARIETVYRPGTLTAVAWRGTGDARREVGRWSLATAIDPSLVVTSDRAELADGPDDLAHVAIELRDAAGTLATGHDTEVTVTVDGPAELAGLTSARPASTERFDGDTVTTFDGRALAVVRPTGPGTVRVTVSTGAPSPGSPSVGAVSIGAASTTTEIVVRPT